MDFLTSPAYSVPAIKTARFLKLIAMQVLERVPSFSGLELKVGAKSTVNSGSCSPVRSGCGPDEELAREQSLPGPLRHHANREGIFRIGARVTVLHEQLGAFPGLDQARVNLIENLLGHGLVD